MKYFYSILLSFLLLAPFTALAVNSSALNAANTLNKLGLFSGVGTSANGTPVYDLEREPTRYEAVTMLVRLLGKETDAKTGTWKTPFSDVDEWAKPYVGYAYSNGLTFGVSDNSFGGKKVITASQYLTFVLRALGYNNTDFQWDKAWELSDKIGLTNGEYNSKNTKFLRADVAQLSYNALDCNIKDTGEKLINKMVEENVVDYTTSAENGLLEEPKSVYIKYYKLDDNFFEILGWTYYLQDNLIFVDQDISVAEIEEPETDNIIKTGEYFGTAWEIQRLILFGMIKKYKIEETSNPYIKKLIDYEPHINVYDFNGGKEETIWYSMSKSYTPTWIEINGIKIYNLNSNGELYQVQNGIRYYNGHPCVNDIFRILGIDKQIIVGETDGEKYIEIR